MTMSATLPMKETKTEPDPDNQLLEIIEAGYNIPISKSEIAIHFGFPQTKFYKMYSSGKITDEMIIGWGYDVTKFKNKRLFHFTNPSDLKFLLWVKSVIGDWR